MLTPAQKHFQKVMAERHGKSDEQTDTARTAHEQILHRMRMDMSALRRIQSDVAKAALKRQILPNYEGWIEGTLEGNSGRPDEVITRLMIWAIDAGDYAQAVRIGRYVIAHNLAMPDKFNRTAATALVDEICDPILVQVKADDATDVAPFLTMLNEIAQFTQGSDMPDVVRAKLCKARAFALRHGTVEEQELSLALLRQALTLDAGAGVKKEIDRLARQVKKASATESAGDSESPSASGSTAEGATSVPETVATPPVTVSKPRRRSATSKGTPGRPKKTKQTSATNK